ncbi:MAG: redoxin domain-containing protein [Akkermansia sp.]|nr:redoxin domain-containing protein [Akkermansia sp.]
MKIRSLLILALGLCVMLPCAAPAQDVEVDPIEETDTPRKNKKKDKKKKDKKKDKKKKKAKPGAVAKALKKVKRVTGKVNQDALVYYYLESASWCGPCKQAMPEIVKHYAEMREDGRAEIVLVGWDYTPDGVKSYIEGYDCKMPAVHRDARNVNKLPGYKKAVGIPTVTIVDADGNVLREGSGPYFVSTWREQVAKVEAKRKAAEEAAAAEAEADEES